MAPVDRKPGQERPIVVMVATRELDGQYMAGRLRTARAIRAALAQACDLRVVRLPNVLTDYTLRRIWDSSWAWLGSLVRGPILPTQCALFASPHDFEQLLAQIPADVTSVYLDGVRSYLFLAFLRRRRPELRVIVDLDDLMSRRMDLLLHVGEPLSPGYLTQHLPRLVQKLAMSQFVGNLIVRFERLTLTRVEHRMAALADVLVLAAVEEARILKARLTTPQRARVEVITPAAEVLAEPRRFTAPERFVFIGSDALTQNRLTIDYLIDIWRRERPRLPLVLYGLCTRVMTLPDGVSVAGYVEDLGEVYDGRSVLLTPSLIGGGVKTKVLEAFARSAPVIGNAQTFESMDLGQYPLIFNDEAGLVEIIKHPEQQVARFVEATAAGAAHLKLQRDPQAFADRWCALMLSEAAAPQGAAAGASA